MQKWYVVYIGRVPGVYTEWSECQDQVNGFRGNNYKGFNSKKDAEASYLKFLLAGERKKNGLKNFIIHVLLIVITFLLYVIIV